MARSGNSQGRNAKGDGIRGSVNGGKRDRELGVVAQVGAHMAGGAVEQDQCSQLLG